MSSTVSVESKTMNDQRNEHWAGRLSSEEAEELRSVGFWHSGDTRYGGVMLAFEAALTRLVRAGNAQDTLTPEWLRSYVWCLVASNQMRMDEKNCLWLGVSSLEYWSKKQTDGFGGEILYISESTLGKIATGVARSLSRVMATRGAVTACGRIFRYRRDGTMGVDVMDAQGDLVDAFRIHQNGEVIERVRDYDAAEWTRDGSWTQVPNQLRRSVPLEEDDQRTPDEAEVFKARAVDALVTVSGVGDLMARLRILSAQGTRDLGSPEADGVARYLAQCADVEDFQSLPGERDFSEAEERMMRERFQQGLVSGDRPIFPEEVVRLGIRMAGPPPPYHVRAEDDDADRGSEGPRKTSQSRGYVYEVKKEVGQGRFTSGESDSDDEDGSATETASEMSLKQRVKPELPEILQGEYGESQGSTEELNQQKRDLGGQTQQEGMRKVVKQWTESNGPQAGRNAAQTTWNTQLPGGQRDGEQNPRPHPSVKQHRLQGPGRLQDLPLEQWLAELDRMLHWTRADLIAEIELHKGEMLDGRELRVMLEPFARDDLCSLRSSMNFFRCTDTAQAYLESELLKKKYLTLVRDMPYQPGTIHRWWSEVVAEAHATMPAPEQRMVEDTILQRYRGYGPGDDSGKLTPNKYRNLSTTQYTRVIDLPTGRRDLPGLSQGELEAGASSTYLKKLGRDELRDPPATRRTGDRRATGNKGRRWTPTQGDGGGRLLDGRGEQDRSPEPWRVPPAHTEIRGRPSPTGTLTDEWAKATPELRNLVSRMTTANEELSRRLANVKDESERRREEAKERTAKRAESHAEEIEGLQTRCVNMKADMEAMSLGMQMRRDVEDDLERSKLRLPDPGSDAALAALMGVPERDGMRKDPTDRYPGTSTPRTRFVEPEKKGKGDSDRPPGGPPNRKEEREPDDAGDDNAGGEDNPDEEDPDERTTPQQWKLWAKNTAMNESVRALSDVIERLENRRPHHEQGALLSYKDGLSRIASFSEETTGGRFPTWAEWRSHYEDICSDNQFTHLQKRNALNNVLEGQAKRYRVQAYQAQRNENPDLEVEDVGEALRYITEKIVSETTVEQAQEKLQTLVHQRDQTIVELEKEIRRLADIGYSADANRREAAMCAALKRSVGYLSLKQALGTQRRTTPEARFDQQVELLKTLDPLVLDTATARGGSKPLLDSKLYVTASIPKTEGSKGPARVMYIRRSSIDPEGYGAGSDKEESEVRESETASQYAVDSTDSPGPGQQGKNSKRGRLRKRSKGIGRGQMPSMPEETPGKTQPETGTPGRGVTLAAKLTTLDEDVKRAIDNAVREAVAARSPGRGGYQPRQYSPGPYQNYRNPSPQGYRNTSPRNPYPPRRNPGGRGTGTPYSPQKSSQPPPSNKAGQTGGRMPYNKGCFKCGVDGHFARNCPQLHCALCDKCEREVTAINQLICCVCYDHGDRSRFSLPTGTGN